DELAGDWAEGEAVAGESGSDRGNLISGEPVNHRNLIGRDAFDADPGLLDLHVVEDRVDRCCSVLAAGDAFRACCTDSGVHVDITGPATADQVVPLAQLFEAE